MSFKFLFLFNATSHAAPFVLSFTVFNFFISKDFLGGIFAFYWIPTAEINGEKKAGDWHAEAAANSAAEGIFAIRYAQ